MYLITADFGLTFGLASYKADQLDGNSKNFAQVHAIPDSVQFETAMVVKKEQHKQLNTWKLMDLSSSCKVINSLWVFK